MQHPITCMYTCNVHAVPATRELLKKKKIQIEFNQIQWYYIISIRMSLRHCLSGYKKPLTSIKLFLGHCVARLTVYRISFDLIFFNTYIFIYTHNNTMYRYDSYTTKLTVILFFFSFEDSNRTTIT